MEGMSKALVPMNTAEVMTIGKTMADSGFFSDANEASKAVVKILAGAEMGFGPFASMVNINIIKGKPTISGNLMAAAVKAHPKYDYRVAQLTGDICEIVFFETEQEVGRSTFTKADAVAAEVGKMVAPGHNGSMIKRFPRNMLFNRAMSNGVRWFCPDVFLGAPVYTPDELGAEVDDAGDVITVTPTVVESFDLDNPPPFQSWQQVKETAVRELYYTHINHVENALAKIFDGQDKKTLTYAAGWKGLLDHHRSKEVAADDSQEDWPTTEELEAAPEVVA
jgi:hypothetical protein